MKIDFELFKKNFKELPLGLRINNLGCIRYNSNNLWIGQTGSYRGFARFNIIENGLRAMTFIIMRYIHIYRLFDIKSILEKYAPEDDGNSPKIYAQIVSQQTGFYFIPVKIVELREVLPVLIFKMTCVENGKDYYIKALQTDGFVEYFTILIKKYIDQYLVMRVYPVHGKKETI